MLIYVVSMLREWEGKWMEREGGERKGVKGRGE